MTYQVFRLAHLSKGIQAVKGLVDQAVKVSTEASLVWAGVCIVLPLMTNIHAASVANRDGFLYVTQRLGFYLILEKRLQPKKDPETKRADGDELQSKLYENLVALYEKLLEFQIQSVIRLYRPSYAKDLFLLEDWSSKKEVILKLEDTFNRDLRQIMAVVDQGTLRQIEEILSQSNRFLTDLLPIAEKGLEVQEQHRDIAKEMLDKMPDQGFDEMRQCH
ncbi:hypothetical protein BO94DRAFT_591194 [Aspergillus sclerotioniger CBS 115572]|uniref:NWD NACHT-NTPase N-terminal domain-containing protein n=1 Tax=Aspergillus sclerotioniger CBS 115572 TaxID=1450535 RepID=A0A317UYV8_9EURO|nr:hypothetical protein BO94DRAFT_591194 [Aspergillus sclerotioniger CBS 115572]PWY66381.1 hypothetical protein BO94DRAFT_591194 [Aspergillus sclerotioniger CBS 115572]